MLLPKRYGRTGFVGCIRTTGKNFGKIRLFQISLQFLKILQNRYPLRVDTLSSGFSRLKGFLVGGFGKVLKCTRATFFDDT